MTKLNALFSYCLLAVAASASAQHAGHEGKPVTPAASPYAGEQSREIKALSAQDQRAWAEGQGMGLAQAAELNGYPGPMHVLELADHLQLTGNQSAATQALKDEHKAEVRRLGVRLLEAERELDALFRDRRATEADIRQCTQAIANLQAEIRASHLSTHLKQTELLTVVQVDRYNVLRGYR
jgi:hypothetical protein